MSIFKDISHFSRTSDYLPIFTGILLQELITISIFLGRVRDSKILRLWYHKYQLAGVLCDITVVFLGMIIARFLYPFIFDSFSIWKFTLLAVVIQIIHDSLFYQFFKSIPRGVNTMLDLFKDYAIEAKINAIWGDSVIIAVSCLFASILANYNWNIVFIIMMLGLYFLPYILYI